MKFLKASLLLFVTFILLAPDQVQARGTLSICLATIKRVEIKSENGSWITVMEPDREIDIENEPLTISFFNNGRLPVGSYRNFRIVLSEHFRVSGEDHGNFTNEMGKVEIRGTAKTAKELPGIITDFIEETPTWNDKTEGLMSQHLNLNNADPDDEITIVAESDLRVGMAVNKGSFIQVDVEIHMGGCLYFASASLVSFEKLPPSRKGMLFILPNKVENMIITIDGKQKIITGDEMTISL